MRKPADGGRTGGVAVLAPVSVSVSVSVIGIGIGIGIGTGPASWSTWTAIAVETTAAGSRCGGGSQAETRNIVEFYS